jgi:tol-pal system protein YbgF
MSKFLPINSIYGGDMFRHIFNIIFLMALVSGIILGCGSSRNEAGDDSSKGEAERQQELDEIEALLGITPEEKQASQEKQKQQKGDDDMLGLLDAESVPVQDQTSTTPTPQKTAQADKEIKELKAQLEKKDALIADLKAQIRNQSEQIYQMETRKQAASGPTYATGPVSDVAPGEYQQRYDQALDLFHSSQYKAAREMFQSLLASDASNSLSDNAQYWIGECNYAMRQYKKAIMDFEKVFTFPQSNKNDAAQFKLGLCYEQLGDAAKAREEFQRLVDVYPKSEYVSRARQHLSSL